MVAPSPTCSPSAPPTPPPATRSRRAVPMRNPKILVLDREELVGQLQGLGRRPPPVPDVIGCSRMDSVAEVLEEQGPFDVLVAGPSLGTRSGLARLQLIREDQPEHEPRPGLQPPPRRRPPATSSAPAPSTCSGSPSRTGSWPTAVNRARASLSQSRTRTTAAVQAAGRHQRLAPPGGRGRGSSPSPSATGGCGKTFYATNLAYFLTRYSGKRVPASSTSTSSSARCSTALRLRPKFTIFDALAARRGRRRRPRAGTSRGTRSSTRPASTSWPPPGAVEADRHLPAGRHPDPQGRPHRTSTTSSSTPHRQLNELVLAAFDLSRPALRDGHPRPAQRPEHERLPEHARPAEGAGRQRQAHHEQGRVRRRHRPQPGHPAVPPGLRVDPPLRQGGVPLDQPRDAGDGGVAPGRDQPADDRRHEARSSRSGDQSQGDRRGRDPKKKSLFRAGGTAEGTLP